MKIASIPLEGTLCAQLPGAKPQTQWGPQFTEIPIMSRPVSLMVWLSWNQAAPTGVLWLFSLSANYAEAKAEVVAGGKTETSECCQWHSCLVYTWKTTDWQIKETLLRKHEPGSKPRLLAELSGTLMQMPMGRGGSLQEPIGMKLLMEPDSVSNAEAAMSGQTCGSWQKLTCLSHSGRDHVTR